MGAYPTIRNMDNEETTVEETTPSASEEEKTTVETPEDNTEEPSTENLDYKGELEQLSGVKTELSQAQHTIEKLKKDKKEAPSIDEDSLFEKLDNAAKEREGVTLKRLQQNSMEDRIRSMTGSEDEAKLALYHYNNTLQASGDNIADAENAIALANRKRVSIERSEAFQAARSASTRGNGSGAGNKVRPEKAPEVSDEDRKVAQAFGLTEDQLAGGYDREAEKAKRKQIVP